MKNIWKNIITTVKPKYFYEENENDHGGFFQQQSTQRLINEYGHMNSQNECWMMRLKVIKVEYYSIES